MHERRQEDRARVRGLGARLRDVVRERGRVRDELVHRARDDAAQHELADLRGEQSEVEPVAERGDLVILTRLSELYVVLSS